MMKPSDRFRHGRINPEDIVTDIIAIIESAVVEHTLPQSVNGTVRAVSGKIIGALGGDARAYSAVKTVIRSAYDRAGTVGVEPASFAREVAPEIESALSSLGDETPEQPEPKAEEPVTVETPTVESLTEALAMLGRTEEDSPEVLGDRLREVLARFGITSP